MRQVFLTGLLVVLGVGIVAWDRIVDELDRRRSG